MDLTIVSAEQVRELLPMADCIEAMASAMLATSTGGVSIPPRIIAPLIDDSAFFGVMPGSFGEPAVYGAKVISLHPDNPAQGRPAIQGFVTLFDHHTGTPLAIIEGAEITAIRTAAASGLATRILARDDSRTLGIFGYGVQARSHVEAMATVREIDEVIVTGRSRERARAFADQHSSDLGVAIRVGEPEQAAACDIVCTVTGSPTPVLGGAWLSPGAHVNLVGAHTRQTRESDDQAIVRSTVWVDSIESALNEAGDLLIPLENGSISKDHVRGEIGKVLTGELEGRTSSTQITLYKSLGIVAQDLVAAHLVYERALARRTGSG